MSSYRAYKQKALQNPEVKTEYDALQSQYDITQAMIEKDLSAKRALCSQVFSHGRKEST